MTHLDVIRTCKAFGCTPDQAKAQFKANAAQMRLNQDKAEFLGKYRGYTAEEWRVRADRFEIVLAD